MPSQRGSGFTRFLKSAFTMSVAAFGTLAAAVAIAGLGWWGAIEYYDLREQIRGVYLSAVAQDLKIENDQLRKKNETLEERLATRIEAANKIQEKELKIALTRLGKTMFPNEREWEALSYATLTAMAAMKDYQSEGWKAAEHLQEWVKELTLLRTMGLDELMRKYKDPDKISEEVFAGLQEYGKTQLVAERILMSKYENIKARLEGNDLLETVSSENGEAAYLIIPTYHLSYGINLSTWQLESFSPSSQPTRYQRKIEDTIGELGVEMRRKQETDEGEEED